LTCWLCCHGKTVFDGLPATIEKIGSAREAPLQAL
jgi:hypothetical protein